MTSTLNVKRDLCTIYYVDYILLDPAPRRVCQIAIAHTFNKLNK